LFFLSLLVSCSFFICRTLATVDVIGHTPDSSTPPGTPPTPFLLWLGRPPFFFLLKNLYIHLYVELYTQIAEMQITRGMGWTRFGPA